MMEIKKVVVLDGGIINVGEMAEMPEGATIEEREMFYTEEHGWRVIGWTPPPTAEEQLKADLEYLAIMTGVEL